MDFIQLKGQAAVAHLAEIGALRVRVFRDYPYLYDGELAYEARYLESYFACPESLVILAVNEGKLVGAPTGLPLVHAEAAWQSAFDARGMDKNGVFYFGESVLLHDYRGKGIGKQFFDLRESYARTLPGVTQTAFCAVRRPDADPRRPAAYRPLDAFWAGRGYRKVQDLTATFHWKEVGTAGEVAHTMDFWLRPF